MKRLANYETGFRKNESKKSNKNVVIEGMANVSVPDRGKDLIPGNVWQLDNFKKNAILLFNHDRNFPIGTVTDVKMSDKGLHARATISKSKNPEIMRIRDLIEEGILKTFSVGFDTEEEPVEDEKGNYVFKDAELLELSVVTLPMNQESTFNVTQKDFQTKSLDELREMLTPKVNKDDVNKTDKEMEEEKPLEDEKETHEEEKGLSFKGSGITSTDEEHFHIYSLDSEGNGETSIPNNGEPHVHAVENFVVLPAADGGHIHEIKKDEKEGEEQEEEKAEDEEESGLDSNEGEEEGDEEEKLEGAEFKECVEGKIPTLIDEGKSQDEAVSIAMQMCKDKKSCNPSLDNIKEFIVFAENISNNKQNKESGNVQVKEGEEATQNISTTTDPSQITNPQLDAQHQTNVLLGVLINEMKILKETFIANANVKVEEPLLEESTEQGVQSEESKSLAQEHTAKIDLILRKAGF